MLIRPLKVLLAAIALFPAALEAVELPSWKPLPSVASSDAITVNRDASVLLARPRSIGSSPPLRSLDAGTTWTPFSIGGQYPARFIPVPRDPTEFYALVGGAASELGPSTPVPSALYHSSDAGANWQLVNPAMRTPSGAVLGQLVPGAAPGLLFAGELGAWDCTLGMCSYWSKRLYLSEDFGVTWRSIDEGLNTSSDGRTILPSPGDPDVAYAATYSDQALFRTTDRGRTWTRLQTPAVEPFGSVFWARSAVDANNPMLLYVMPGPATDVWVSEDGGGTWRTSRGLNLSGGYRAPIADPLESRRVYVVGTYGDAVESRDAGKTWRRIAPAGPDFLVERGSWPGDGTPAIALSGGRRSLFAETGQASAPQKWMRLTVDETALVLGSDLWWTPSEPGTGISITQHASGQMFVVWFATEGGRPVWRVISGGTWTDSHTFVGTLYTASGQPFFRTPPFDSQSVSVARVGSATLRFADDDRGTFSYQLDAGGSGAKDISRFLFAPSHSWSTSLSADIWMDPTAPGWGLTVSHQFNKVFAVLYAYDAEGKATWVTAPDTAINFLSPISFAGAAYRSLPDGSQANVGSLTIALEADGRLRLVYTIDGVTGSRILSRVPF